MIKETKRATKIDYHFPYIALLTLLPRNKKTGTKVYTIKGFFLYNHTTFMIANT